jgi:hypothetical protein
LVGIQQEAYVVKYFPLPENLLVPHVQAILLMPATSDISSLFSSAVKILTKAGSVVNMTVAKRAVFKHGLVELLSNVAPVQQGMYDEIVFENENIYHS